MWDSLLIPAFPSRLFYRLSNFKVSVPHILQHHHAYIRIDTTAPLPPRSGRSNMGPSFRSNTVNAAGKRSSIAQNDGPSSKKRKLNINISAARFASPTPPPPQDPASDHGQDDGIRESIVLNTQANASDDECVSQTSTTLSLPLTDLDHLA